MAGWTQRAELRLTAAESKTERMYGAEIDRRERRNRAVTKSWAPWICYGGFDVDWVESMESSGGARRSRCGVVD
ncbi:hypothetical protein M0R45_038116 [Rubus argutus]|uniref:Uncharacterized protein n=1 Tax=Rubus argutus TaxID=59490 RepID=A0AAW1W2L5_RUBAR